MIIYYADIKAFSDEFFIKAQNIIPLIKREYINKLKVEQRKKESLLGWYLCDFALKEQGVSDYEIMFTEKEKPFVKNNNIYFNISHSNGFVCCAVSYHNVGIDVEMPKKCGESVIRRVLCHNELEMLLKSNDTERDFIRLWTLKESCLKHSGQGICGGLEKLDFSAYENKTEFEYMSLNFKTAELCGFMFSVCSLDNEYEFIEFCEH